jgi:hypothetical protein
MVRTAPLAASVRISQTQCMKRNHKWGALGGKLSNSKKRKVQRSADASKRRRRGGRRQRRRSTISWRRQVCAFLISERGDELMQFRDFWRDKLERNEVTPQRFRAKIRRAYRKVTEERKNG